MVLDRLQLHPSQYVTDSKSKDYFIGIWKNNSDNGIGRIFAMVNHIEIAPTREHRNILLLSGLFIASLVTANMIGSKLVLVCGVTVSLGAFIIPMTFVLTDLLTELYGKKMASLVVLIGVFVQLYVLLLVWLGRLIPSIETRNLDLAYEQMFSLTPRMILASIVAYTISQLLDVQIFLWLKNKTEGKHLWLRNNVSSIISLFLDSFIFIFLFLYGILPIQELVKTSLSISFIKLLLTVCDTPFVYLGKFLLEEKK